jgi:hypothetical protein
MPKSKKLAQSYSDGDLGKLLAEKFNGKVGYSSGREDSNFLVVFQDEVSTPGIFEIEEVIREYCRQLDLEILNPNREVVVGNTLALIARDRLDPWSAFLQIAISTNYPYKGMTNAIRVTTQVRM